MGRRDINGGPIRAPRGRGRFWQRLNKSGSWKLLNGLIGSGAKRDDVFCLDKVRLNVNQIFAPLAPRIRGKRSALLFFREQRKLDLLYVAYETHF